MTRGMTASGLMCCGIADQGPRPGLELRSVFPWKKEKARGPGQGNAYPTWG